MYWPSLFAYSDPFVVGACLTHDVAAPMKFAVTPFGSPHAQRVITSAAAQRFTVINAFTCFVAQPPHSARRIVLRVVLTKVWRILIIQQICGECRRVDIGVWDKTIDAGFV